MGTARGFNLILKSCTHFYPEDTGHRIINTGHGNSAVFHLSDSILNKCLPISRHHHHIDTGNNRLGTLAITAPRHLAMTVPVTDNKAIEAHGLF